MTRREPSLRCARRPTIGRLKIDDDDLRGQGGGLLLVQSIILMIHFYVPSMTLFALSSRWMARFLNPTREVDD